MRAAGNTHGTLKGYRGQLIFFRKHVLFPKVSKIAKYSILMRKKLSKNKHEVYTDLSSEVRTQETPGGGSCRVLRRSLWCPRPAMAPAGLVEPL